VVPADKVEGIVAVALEVAFVTIIGLAVPYHLRSFPADAVAVNGEGLGSPRQYVTGVNDTVG
jgi:hypothetical protein